MGETIRCFIAIELTPEIKELLQKIEDELKPKIPGVKWVKPAGIHLTLKFLGHIDRRAMESVITALAAIAQSAKPFILSLSSPGAFPTFERPSIIWIGINKGSEEIAELANVIDDKVSEFGVEKESRPFHPHLTLGRIGSLKDKTALKNVFSFLNIPPFEMAVSKLTLFKSALTRQGAVYEVLHEADLA